jgi:hypothetical protein
MGLRLSMQRFRIADLGRFDEVGCGELVQFPAVVLQVQTIGNAPAKRQFFRGEAVFVSLIVTVCAWPQSTAPAGGVATEKNPSSTSEPKRLSCGRGSFADWAA